MLKESRTLLHLLKRPSQLLGSVLRAAEANLFHTEKSRGEQTVRAKSKS